MKQKEKSAIVRLLSDLIKADTVIDTREIDLFEKICSRYNIDVPETLVEAQKLTLSEALSALEALSASERRTLVEDLENIAIADGKCEPEEALLLLALRQILSGEGGDTIDCGCDVPDNIAPFTVFYVESEYDEDTNNAKESSQAELGSP